MAKCLPSWVCNKQNNLIDDEWFGYSGSFNEEKENSWVSKERVTFKMVRYGKTMLT